MKCEVIKVAPKMSDEKTAKLAGQFLQEDSIDILVTGNCDMYCEETGKTLAKFRKRAIHPVIQANAYGALLKMAGKYTENRGMAAGFSKDKFEETRKPGEKAYHKEGSVRFNRIKKDGSVSNTQSAISANSQIMGYMDRNPRFPYCRTTSFNQEHLDKFNKALPIIKVVDNLYAELMPKEYGKQRAMADKTDPSWVISDTAFTTVTVNKNWQTAVHQDKGDYQEGFGNLVALRAGEFNGGYFVLPKWGVGFDLQNGDVLLVDVHQWHGNTPIEKQEPGAVRLSLVMYYREKMVNCGSPEEELERVKKSR